MLTWFLPRAKQKILSESKLVCEALRRNRLYAQDLLSENQIDQVKTWEKEYVDLIKSRNFDGLSALNKEVKKQGSKIFPPSPYEEWRENVESFVVTAVIFIALRTFFLQPFQIPTGSMEPTLSGIEPIKSHKPPPNALVQIYDFVIHGRTYSQVFTKQGGTITKFEPGFFFLKFLSIEYTDVYLTDSQGHEEVDRVWIRYTDVIHHENDEFPDKIGLKLGDTYQPGDELVNLIVQTGDKVLVDRLTYHFRTPAPGDVIIFETKGIDFLDRRRSPTEDDQVFIKRCIAVGGDTVTVKPPQLFVNGHLATGADAFARQFARSNSYPGYTLIGEDFHPLDPGGQTQTYLVPPDSFWAMGDNSPHSEDSRYFGGVPRKNFVGKGAFVFWPFTERWGFIK